MNRRTLLKLYREAIEAVVESEQGWGSADYKAMLSKLAEQAIAKAVKAAEEYTGQQCPGVEDAIRNEAESWMDQRDPYRPKHTIAQGARALVRKLTE
jgi:hypothetical protein